MKEQVILKSMLLEQDVNIAKQILELSFLLDIPGLTLSGIIAKFLGDNSVTKLQKGSTER